MRRIIDLKTGEETIDEAWVPPAPPPDPDFVALDAAVLNRVLTQDGSIVRALAEVMFTEINKLRAKNGDAPYTKTQFLDALRAKMRS